MRDYQYLIEPQCYENIYSFYHNVALKYRHTYSEELMQQNRRTKQAQSQTRLSYALQEGGRRMSTDKKKTNDD